MSQQDRARIAVAAEQRLAEQVASNEQWLTNAIAKQQELLVIDEANARAARDGQVVPVPAQQQPAVVARSVSTDTEAPAATLPPLPQTFVDGVFAGMARADPQGTAALQREWGGDAAANLTYGYSWLSEVLEDDEWEATLATPLTPSGVLRILATVGRRRWHGTFGREEAHTPAAATTKGTPSMTESERMQKTAEFRRLTKPAHDADARHDHQAKRELFALRDKLGEELFPGSSGPRPDQQQVI